VERDVIDARIDGRVEEMFAAGFVDEVRGLIDRGVAPDAPAMSSIGYREIVRHLRGEISIEEAKELTRRATRRLVRRQSQWFRRGDPRITWVRDSDTIDMQANIFTGVCTNAVLRPGR
jgi:tRNA dimethylallyltransferase